MDKIDLKKTLKLFYKAPKDPVIVEVPKFQFLMIDGQGDPGTAQSYQDAIQTLYPLSYGLKFLLKKSGVVDYGVMPLEGLWWAEDMAAFTVAGKRDEWLRTAMIMQPDFVTKEQVQQTIETVGEKKNPPALEKVRFESYHEGVSVQILHLGPFAEEGPTIERMHQYAFDQGYKRRGKHHEIYLSDFRRTAPEKLRTILRQPLSK